MKRKDKTKVWLLESYEGKRLKRTMCKNMYETGRCKFGRNCHYAHSQEELDESDRIAEKQAKEQDNYKTQNCTQFHKEKVCFYGARCIFRHEQKRLKKIHKHYYIVHLAALHLTHCDVLEEASQAQEAEGVSTPSTPTTLSECSDEECDVCPQEPTHSLKKESEVALCVSGTRRLGAFIKITDDEAKMSDSE